MTDSQTAADLNWDQIPHFSPGEWPPGVLDRMHPSVILALSDIRNALPDRAFISPSPVPGAHVRDRGTRRHGTDHGRRLSNATDFFIDWSWAWHCWQAIQAHPAIGGAGIYPDMLWGGEQGRRCMFHIDTEDERLVWLGYRLTPSDKTRYVYMAHEPIKFHRLLAERGQT